MVLRQPSRSPLSGLSGWQAVCLWLLALFSTAAHAVETTAALADGFMVDRWTVEDGLRIDHINDLALGKDGGLWIVSFDGLILFDGQQFRHFRAAETPGLDENRLVRGATTADGTLWLLTESGDLVRHRDGVFQTHARGGLSDARLELFWVGPRGLAASARMRRGAPLAVDASPPWDWITGRWTGALLQLEGGTPEREEVSAWVPPQPPDDDELADLRDATRAITEAWGIVPTGEPTRGDPVALCIEAMGAPEGCAWSMDARPRGAESPLGTWTLDRDEVWLDDRLIYRSERPILAVQPLPDGSLFVADLGTGLVLLRKSSARTIQAPGAEPVPSVRGVYVDPSQTVWMLRNTYWDGVLADGSTRTGVARAGHHSAVSGRPCAPGDVCHSTELGWLLATHLPADVAARARELRARSFARTTDGTVWVGTAADGLLCFRQGVLSAKTTTDGLSSMAIRGLAADGASLWVATEDAGLCWVGPGGQPISCLGPRDGLFDDALNGVRLDHLGRVWMSGNQGVSWALRSELLASIQSPGTPVSTLTYRERDGMGSRETNGQVFRQVAEQGDGTLLFPAQQGVVAFDPGALPLPEAPPVSWTSVRVDGVDRTADARAGRLRLDADAHEVSVTWRAVEFVWAHELRFQHRLLGPESDSAWSPLVAERTATWSGLPPGDTTLQLASRLGGAWGPVATVLIHRSPAFNETVWYPISIVLIGILGTGLVAGGRVRALRRTQQRLEEQVAERTAQLAQQNAKIRAQAVRLAQLNDARTRFIANASHELRTPVALVVGPLEDLSQEALRPEARASLEMARRNAHRLSDLTAQLLDIARLDGGGLPLRARPVDLAAFLRRILDRFAGAGVHREVALQIDVPEDPVVVFLDPDQIDRVVTNLLSNALKFTMAGGSVTLALEAPSPRASPDGATEESAVFGENDMVSVRVQDTGIGIEEDAQQRIFDRFYQVEQGDSRRFEGSGLGLALCRELVDLHGGELTVHSQPGVGSVFSFTLPLGVDHLRPEDIATVSSVVEAPHAAVPARAPDGEGRPTVLVVEDNDDMRAYLVAHVSRRFEVLEATDGVDGLAKARAAVPALVLTDVMMPRMDGLSMCAELARDPRLSSVPRVVVSAKTGVEDRTAALEVAQDFIGKPFSMTELMQRVQRQLDRGTRADQGGPSGPGPAEASSGATPVEPAVDAALVARIEAAIRDNLATPRFSTTQLARAVAMSPRHLQRELVRLRSISPTELIRSTRLEAARQMLQEGHYATISEVAAAVGFSRSYFTRVYAAWAGHPPTEDLLARSTAPGLD